MKTNGFTLVELMVVIAIMGILSAIAVPKFFGQTSKAKAAELAPAAMTYITLQKAYLTEKQKIGTWKRIGYSAPRSGDHFNYNDGGVIKHSIKQSDFAKDLAGDGVIGWQAENTIALDNCKSGNKWTISIIAQSKTSVYFKSNVTSGSCEELTKGWGLWEK
ncbi:type IV pilin protein [Fibrobacter sp. UWEL]|uniref:type IV pilin protein n=1 Tax=Fibrobacter sp. UWEL TaxID=1896209 RepID=UPI0009150935|nr:type II secretion system protein [Fibrobacter sp. UWEL]SHK63198.1 prepilin-type N-terminal cleavage/methylation domain-containing protein [Fibrobacter sp. UWEL]